MMKKVLLSLSALVSMFCSPAAQAALHTEEIVYHVDGKAYTGYLAYDDEQRGKRPGILVAHEWWGYNAYVRHRAEMLAKLGYTAFALDMYGDGRHTDHPDTAQKMMQAVMGDLPEAEKRFRAAYEILKSQPTVDPRRIAAIGYCMGGGLVLEMARRGAPLAGVVVFHGSLGTATPAKRGDIKGRVLALIGADDPFEPPAQIKAFKAEMRAAGVKYQLHLYPGVVHAYTNPDATGLGRKYNLPLAYNAAADADSWKRMRAFFRKLFH